MSLYKSTQNNIIPNQLDACTPSYEELLTASLIHYASTDGAFAQHFLSLIAGLSRRDTTAVSLSLTEAQTKILLPGTTEQAIRRADWLADQLERQTLPHWQQALALASAWGIHNAQEQPKAVVLGFKVGIMPLGLMGHQKLQENMPIIARADVVKSGNTTFTNLVTKASLGALDKALSLVSHNARMLEPEMGDWFTGDKSLNYYRASEDDMARIERELAIVNVIHATSSDEQGVAVIAMSPAVNTTYPEAHWSLEPLFQ